MLQIVGTTAALILVVPGLIYALRNRQRAVRFLTIGGALVAVSVLLFWLMVRQ